MQKKLLRYVARKDSPDSSVRDMYNELKGQEQTLYWLELFQNDPEMKKRLLSDKRLLSPRQL